MPAPSGSLRKAPRMSNLCAMVWQSMHSVGLWRWSRGISRAIAASVSTQPHVSMVRRTSCTLMLGKARRTLRNTACVDSMWSAIASHTVSMGVSVRASSTQCTIGRPTMLMRGLGKRYPAAAKGPSLMPLMGMHTLTGLLRAPRPRPRAKSANSLCLPEPEASGDWTWLVGSSPRFVALTERRSLSLPRATRSSSTSLRS
mmetsp:Transcript_27759/g.74720  ORF Transcript_27759/g.74720 Transcript_27759/m.74720 type:complete len:200 (-) Transcript_27759:49-648(-)